MVHAAYIHIPFCAHKCDFCDFTVVAGLDEHTRDYCQVLAGEIVERIRFQPTRPMLSSVYYGGGTPGHISPDNLACAHEALRAAVDISAHAEITLETTPQAISKDKAKAWLDLGINRLSVGVESLNNGELTALGRAATRDDALGGLAVAFEAGFTNVGCDLLYGIPEQTSSSWENTLDEILSLPIQHLSAYGLTIGANSRLARRYGPNSAKYVTEDGFVDMYMKLVEIAQAHGFRQYEISNFSRPGFESQHNLTYWSNKEYLGFGVAACRYINGVRSTNFRSFNRYMTNCLGNESEEIIDEAIRVREATMLALRTRQGINLAEFELSYGVNLLKKYSQAIQRLCEAGLLDISGGWMRLSHRGVMVSNLVMVEFI